VISAASWSAVAVLSATVAADPHAAGNPRTAAAAVVACGPDRPVVQAGQSVPVRAWVSVARPSALRYEWSAAVGAIKGSAAVATWSLPDDDTSLGARRAQVHVSDGPVPIGTCSLEVVVTSPPDTARAPQAVRETGRGFLTKETKEKAGYGLYSYLLLGARPDESNQERTLETIQAYLDVIDEVGALVEAGVADAQLNVTYLPVVAASFGRDASAVLANYDYARARALLGRLPGKRRNGIYFVSSLQALSGFSTGPLLIQDLSKVPSEPKDLIRWWVRAFLNQCAQERFWKPKTGEQLALRTRTIVATIAEGLPEIRKSVKDWIAWLK